MLDGCGSTKGARFLLGARLVKMKVVVNAPGITIL